MEEDFVSKKQNVIVTFDDYISQEISKEEFLDKISGFLQDHLLIEIELFQKTLEEILTYHEELSLKDIKQRKLMLQSYIY